TARTDSRRTSAWMLPAPGNAAGAFRHHRGARRPARPTPGHAFDAHPTRTRLAPATTDALSPMIWIAAYLAAGAGVGFLAGLLGIGGGMTLVPVLAPLFGLPAPAPAAQVHLPPRTATASVPVPSSASGRGRRFPRRTARHRRGNDVGAGARHAVRPAGARPRLPGASLARHRDGLGPVHLQRERARASPPRRRRLDAREANRPRHAARDA